MSYLVVAERSRSTNRFLHVFLEIFIGLINFSMRVMGFCLRRNDKNYCFTRAVIPVKTVIIISQSNDSRHAEFISASHHTNVGHYENLNQVQVDV